MSLLDAIVQTGLMPSATAVQAIKKRYSEVLSSHLAVEVASGLRTVGFRGVKPEAGGPGELEFQGGLGSKRVDVSVSDQKHGLLLAVSVKGINFPDYGKNLKNRFADLCTEAISLHMRFPYACVGGLFVMPAAADADGSRQRKLSTFRRAMRLMATVSGRETYSDVNEKFERVVMMLYQPVAPDVEPWVRLFDALTEQEMSEEAYFTGLREQYNRRNPHAMIGE
jgi:hypothetical protein